MRPEGPDERNPFRGILGKTMATHFPDTRNDLISAAMYCFAKHGYDGTSIRMIAQRAGRPVSLIGHHFGGKEGLYLEVFRYLIAGGLTSLVKEDDPPPDSAEEAIRTFRGLICALYASACPEDPAMDDWRRMGTRLLLSEMRDPRPEILALLQSHLQPWVDRMKACIKWLRPDLAEAEVILLGTSIMGQVGSQSLMAGVTRAIWGRPDLDAVRSAEILAEFCLQGLGVSPRG